MEDISYKVSVKGMLRKATLTVTDEEIIFTPPKGVFRKNPPYSIPLSEVIHITSGVRTVNVITRNKKYSWGGDGAYIAIAIGKRKDKYDAKNR